jgi:hypothetical protein
MNVLRSNVFSSYKEFDGQTLNSLTFERELLFPKIDNPDVIKLMARPEFSDELGGILEGTVPMYELDLEELRKDPENFPLQLATTTTYILDRQFTPNCSPASLTKELVFSEEQPHIHAGPKIDRSWRNSKRGH